VTGCRHPHVLAFLKPSYPAGDVGRMLDQIIQLKHASTSKDQSQGAIQEHADLLQNFSSSLQVGIPRIESAS
jgi:hypothetical protein